MDCRTSNADLSYFYLFSRPTLRIGCLTLAYPVGTSTPQAVNKLINRFILRIDEDSVHHLFAK